MNVVDEAPQLGREFSCLQHVHTENAGDDSLVRLEAKLSSLYDCKKAKTLCDGEALIFNGADIGLQ